MVAPDRVEKGSTDASGRESIRFIKNLSNGVVVVVEKEYKNSPDDMETINIWADLSSNVLDARQRRPLSTTSETVIISSDSVAKIRKDAEEAIRADVEYLQKRANATSGVQKYSITPDILAANERFNEELDEFKAKTHKGLCISANQVQSSVPLAWMQMK